MEFSLRAHIEYKLKAFGTIGEFRTPSGRVGFLETKARLGTTGSDHERRLADEIVPFREVIEAKGLSFGQLLQRDIDDHRVARELIPYLLRQPPAPPAVFPAILCVVLPFAGPKIIETFPERTQLSVVQDPIGFFYEGYRYGEAYEVDRFVTAEGGAYPVPMGRLQWNPESAKVVVLDGQHRTMALLAIQRTINQSWDKGSGTRFRVFYEKTVERLLKDLPQPFDENDLEVPVTICWFREDLSGRTPHEAARILFVDVNRSARPPSRSRLTLLDEGELQAIFAREVLELMRGEGEESALPLYAVEFDNPEKDSYRPVKWSVVTTLDLLRHAVRRCVFGPRDLIDDPGIAMPQGRLPKEAMDRFMHSQIGVADLFPSQIEDGDRVVIRDEIGNEHFPLGERKKLVKAFGDSWGKAFLDLFSRLLPFEAHLAALEILRDEWKPSGEDEQLSFDAIFEGVGVYWTLRDSARDQSATLPPAPAELVSAWHKLDEKKTRFDAHRALSYLGDNDSSSVRNSNRLYRVFLTNACQLGALMAVASLALRTSVGRDGVPGMMKSCIDGWNAALAHEERRLFLDPGPSARHRLNRIRQLNTANSVHHRYFWLELLCSPEGIAHLAEEHTAAARSLRDKARTLYLRLLTEQEASALRELEPDTPRSELMERGRETARGVLRDALDSRMGVNHDAFDSWFDVHWPDAADNVPDQSVSDATEDEEDS